MPSKKTNTAIFMIAGTLLNLVLLFFFIVLGFVLLSLAVNSFPALESAAGFLSIAVFILALVLSFLIYSRLVKWLISKYALEDKLYPLFGSKGRKIGD